MAKITTVTNPLTGQPAQVDQLDHTAQQIDDGIGFESTDYPGCYYRTVDGVTEWFNPPMLIGGKDEDGNSINEYRTTERYLGKPVYTMLINFGALPNATYRVVKHGISNIEQVINAYGSSGYKQIPTNNFNGTKAYSVSIVADKTDIAVLTNFNASVNSANIIVKYTKTTD